MNFNIIAIAFNIDDRFKVCVAVRIDKWYLYNDDFDSECNIICKVEAVHRLQNLFFDIWNKREKLTINTSIRAYLYSSVRNICLNYIKHKKVCIKISHQPQIPPIPL